MIESVTGVWVKFSPHQPIRYAFLDERYATMYADVQRMGRICACRGDGIEYCYHHHQLSIHSRSIDKSGKEFEVRMTT